MNVYALALLVLLAGVPAVLVFVYLLYQAACFLEPDPKPKEVESREGSDQAS